ncbi:hypothetical protein TWF225_007379 [Orbilia oligospora]|uniref:Uncharacterized protein n=1 Tax=Orbilia oligospora TaxID=2813651 RepID=A0A7C8KBW0_ORBOL|nr:hypothetical protein TWF751_010400 [Orbilia oligospora]KAF3180215.1 hypothetical protein TWF225_007379 [Orbilia oligospora]KAF3248983.1 hypothetical protein TWF217_008964 [Orbilia oligospora]KAF3262132.1 hypothetical protein TWF128_002804 [Orbilia oligospora]KAF3290679.1 hypothetical protein TWF132_006757 [Orbilia oligospora]
MSDHRCIQDVGKEKSKSTQPQSTLELTPCLHDSICTLKALGMFQDVFDHEDYIACTLASMLTVRFPANTFLTLHRLIPLQTA